MKTNWNRLLSWAVDGRFIGIEKLPTDQTASGFTQVDIYTEKGMGPEKLLRVIITALGDKPKHGGGILRFRQLITLLKARATRKEKLIFLIHDVHQLPPRSIQSFKYIREAQLENRLEYGIVFLGDMPTLKKKLEKVKDVDLRTDIV